MRNAIREALYLFPAALLIVLSYLVWYGPKAGTTLAIFASGFCLGSGIIMGASHLFLSAAERRINKLEA